MLIGENYDKIAFEFMGMDLLEPNSFIGDTLLFLVSLYFFFKLRNSPPNDVFLRSWRWFFLAFGWSFFFGGLGHLLYNYWGIPGKAPSWFLSIIGVYFIERAMISLYEHAKPRKLWMKMSAVKMILALIAAVLVLIFVDLKADYSKGMLVPTINSTIGLVATLGILGYYYARKIAGFRAFWISIIILFPAAIIQGMKINLHPWFDKNDAGHVLLIVGLILYYKGINAYQKHINA